MMIISWIHNLFWCNKLAFKPVNKGPYRTLAKQEADDEAAHLRVIVQPWVHVHVDGQKVDTTPFARPIPLTPGRHHIRLTHPNAPDECRTIDIGPGETHLLDVQMMRRVLGHRFAVATWRKE
jgi:hypothetical protein